MKTIRTFLIQILLITLVVGTLTFIFTLTLGDLDYRIAAGRYGHDLVDSEAAELVRQELGLDQPAIYRYLAWLKDLATWNLGVSLVSGNKITSILVHELGNTLALALVAVAISVFVGPTAGVIVTLSRSKTAENVAIALSVAMRSVPAYVVGIVLIIFFSVYLNMLPAAGCNQLIHYVLPAMTLAIPLSAVSCRITSESLKTVMATDYYEFSMLKGLTKRQTFFRHGLRNMAIPVIAYHGIQLIYLIEGLVVVETLFAWPGIGHSMVHAVVARDIPMIQGTAMTLAMIFVCLNTMLDVICRWVDPREVAR
jgi:peptide/nickel transport system permease protein